MIYKIMFTNTSQKIKQLIKEVNERNEHLLKKTIKQYDKI